MPISLLLLAYLLIASFSLHVLAFALYLQNRHSPELWWNAMLVFSLGSASLALASLLWMEGRFAAKTAIQAPPRAYAEIIERDSGGEDQ